MAGDLNFPESFLWGTATSPTQVEGHIQNEWTDFVAQDGGTCHVACDHYHRYGEAFLLRAAQIPEEVDALKREATDARDLLRGTHSARGFAGISLAPVNEAGA